MKLTASMRVARAAIVLAMLASGIAHADMLINKNVMVTSPSVPLAQTLNLSSAGMLTMTVKDMQWPDALASLSFAITDATHSLKEKDGEGFLTYDVNGPMTLFANVFATATNGTGLYHLDVSFVPSVVPLPAAVWLLASGLFGFGFTRRKHATVTNSVVQ